MMVNRIYIMAFAMRGDIMIVLKDVYLVKENHSRSLRNEWRSSSQIPKTGIDNIRSGKRSFNKERWVQSLSHRFNGLHKTVSISF